MRQHNHAAILRSRPNIFPGPCHVCRVHVPRKEGTAAQTRDGWLLYCGDHEPRGDAPAQADAPPTVGSYRPVVSDAAVATAYALAAKAVSDGNPEAATLAWELVAAAEYARGGDGSKLTAAIDAAIAERDRWGAIAREPAALGPVIDVEAREADEPLPVPMPADLGEQVDAIAKRAVKRRKPERCAAPPSAARGTVGEGLKGWL